MERVRWSSPVTWLLAAVLLFVTGAVTASVTGAARQPSARCDVKDEPVVLDGCDMTGEQQALLDADLRGASLRGAVLDGLRLERVDLTGAHLEGASLRNTWLTGTTLANAWLPGADLRGSVLTDACLRGARLERADLTDAATAGADMTGAAIDGVRGLARAPKPTKAPQSCTPTE